jgi:Zn-dependent peptidase ImmA (M78 family)/DNA-binding XRE family transcriptional regulator
MSFDLNLFGNKLSRCRKHLQLSQQEVASQLGFELERVKALEDGAQEPTGDEIFILSDFFKQDYRFFISNEQKSSSEQVDILYRKFGTEISKQDRWTIQEFIFLCECEEYVLQGIEFERKVFNFLPSGNFFKQHGTDGALALRIFLNQDKNQIITDVYFTFRRIGLHVFRRRLVNSNISGLFINHPFAGRCVLINYDDDIYRQNFTAAHEVGHAIFDHQDNVNVSFIGESTKDLREVRANMFASKFLVPEDLTSTLKKITWTEEHIINTCIKLKVNPQVLLISLKQSGNISEDVFDKFKRIKIPSSSKEDPELAGLPQKIKNAKQVLLDLGLSSFYVRSCHEAYSKGLISANRLAEMLLTNEIELPVLLTHFNLKLHNDY